jgi:hypothetical protein
LKYVIGTGHYLSRVVAPKRNVFLGKHFANPTINLKSPKKIYPTSKINTHPWPKTLPKVYHSVVTHVLYHFCDTSLITACVIFSSLKFRVGCTCTFFGDTICLMTNRKMMKIETLIDLHIVLTYWLSHWFLVLFDIWVSHALEMTINFYYPTLELFCFSLPSVLFIQNFVYPTHSSSVSPPTPINNDRSLISWCKKIKTHIFL